MGGNSTIPKELEARVKSCGRNSIRTNLPRARLLERGLSGGMVLRDEIESDFVSSDGVDGRRLESQHAIISNHDINYVLRAVIAITPSALIVFTSPNSLLLEF